MEWNSSRLDSHTQTLAHRNVTRVYKFTAKLYGKPLLRVGIGAARNEFCAHSELVVVVVVE